MDQIEEVDGAPIESDRCTGAASAYEAPELIELGRAMNLTSGIVETQYYQDCGENGTTRYRPNC